MQHVLLISSHIVHNSYFYRITNEYLGIFLILALLATALLMLAGNYIPYLMTHIFTFPEDQRFKAKRHKEEQKNYIVEILNSVLTNGIIALAVLIYLKPYEEPIYSSRVIQSLGTFLFSTDNYILWFALLFIFLVIGLLRYITIRGTASFLIGLYFLDSWETNTRYASNLMSFIGLGLCLAYILGYIGISGFTYLCLFLVVIVFIIRGLVSFAVSTRLDLLTKINFFIYLCTLEILPLLLGLKYISNQLG